MIEHTDTKYIAVFGDTHGHLRLMFQLCLLWQVQHHKHLHAILQCGDLGYFPDPNNLDRGTKRFAAKDPEELGFKYFTKTSSRSPDTKLDVMLCGPPDDFTTVRCPVYFCHGNHEDFVSLASVVGDADVAPVDCFDRINWLRPGYVHDLDGIMIASIGGSPELPDSPADSQVTEESWKRVNVLACDLLLRKHFHILLSHGSPMGIGGESDQWGSARLRKVVDKCQPDYHFFAHHMNPIPRATVGKTQCYWLNDVLFSKEHKGLNSPVEKGCMGILSWSDQESHEFKVVDEPWIKKVTFSSWWRM